MASRTGVNIGSRTATSLAQSRSPGHEVSVLHEIMFTLARPIDLVVVVLASALKEGFRVEAVLVGLWMFAGCPLGYV